MKISVLSPQTRAGVALTAILCVVSVAVGMADGRVDYARQVKPVLARRCYACHGALKQLAGLRLDSGALIRRGSKAGKIVVPGKPDESRLLARVTTPHTAARMPPEGEPLKKEEVALLRAWIAQGAASPAGEQAESDPRRHWAFLRPVAPRVPQVKNAAWVRNPVDAFIAAEWEQRGLTPAPEAPKEVLLRRVSLDLAGLPPTREDLHAFLADSSPDAYEKVVDRLLASPQYGERWGRHWMDVWRYSDWYGRRQENDVRNSYGQIWRWRDWIVESLNADKGYDRMLQEMLAGDELAPEDPGTAAATGFLVRNWYSLNYNQWMRDNVEHTGKAFLGLTLNCAHCHDHKYDPLSQKEYFQFRAFFEPLELRHDRWPGDADPGPFKKYVYGGSTAVLKSGMIRVFDEKLDAVTHVYQGGDERNRTEGDPPVPPAAPAVLGGDRLKIAPVELPPAAYYPGLRPFVRQEELARREQTLVEARAAVPPDPARIAAAETSVASLRARLAADDARYAKNPDAAAVQTLARAAVEAERTAALRAAEAALAAAEAALQAAKAKAGAAPMDAAAQAAVKAAEGKVPPARAAVDAAVKATAAPNDGKYTPLGLVYPAKSTGRRLALARWLTAPENPLTARVAVNHIWLRHFGRPLVDSVFDFGRNGKRPSHPELLDFLANYLMCGSMAGTREAGGWEYGRVGTQTVSHTPTPPHPHTVSRDGTWRMKHLHRLLVTSRTYRLASALPGTSRATKDPENRYLWRFNHRRLEAEAVRDSILHAAGTLDLTRGGPELDNKLEDSRRRSLYFSVHPEAGGAMRFLATFDAPDACDAYRRTVSVIPQQALALTNSRMSLDHGRLLARNLWKAVEGEPDRVGAFLQAAFEQVLTRRPTTAESAACREFLRKQADLFRGQRPPVQQTAAANGPVSPSFEPLQRAGESLVQALFSHDDFLNLR